MNRFIEEKGIKSEKFKHDITTPLKTTMSQRLIKPEPIFAANLLPTQINANMLKITQKLIILFIKRALSETMEAYKQYDKDQIISIDLCLVYDKKIMAKLEENVDPNDRIYRQSKQPRSQSQASYLDDLYNHCFVMEQQDNDNKDNEEQMHPLLKKVKQDKERKVKKPKQKQKKMKKMFKNVVNKIKTGKQKEESQPIKPAIEKHQQESLPKRYVMRIYLDLTEGDITYHLFFLCNYQCTQYFIRKHIHIRL